MVHHTMVHGKPIQSTNGDTAAVVSIGKPTNDQLALRPVRNTLVAPILPDPTLRKSPPPAIFVSTRPKGTEPNPYPRAAAASMCIQI